MSKVIAIANQKGGVGKSTTSINLSSCLAELNKRVLVIDMDPQGNTTSGLGIDKNRLEKSVYEVLIEEETIDDCIQKDIFRNLDVLPANVSLSGAEIELIDSDNRSYVLDSKIRKIEDNYDYIIIDCPPSLSILTVNALTTANSVIVPIQCEFYALEGISQLMKTIELVKERLNPTLSIEGVVFTMYDSRTNLSAQVVANVKANLNEKIYETVIPRNVRLAESPSHGLPINYYDKKSAGAIGYQQLAKEVVECNE
ncbi:MAG: ParA family protein [Lachnospiraceae bacterium]|nr:ParA family protein [Lachnospiraceae bacterium]